MIEVRAYTDLEGQCPFDVWFAALRDTRAASRVLIRLNRLAHGLEGDAKQVGEGVKELRISEGKGYRVYYGWDNTALAIVLCGGSKATQRKDIAQAKEYWRQYHGK